MEKLLDGTIIHDSADVGAVDRLLQWIIFTAGIMVSVYAPCDVFTRIVQSLRGESKLDTGGWKELRDGPVPVPVVRRCGSGRDTVRVRNQIQLPNSMS